MEAVVKGRGHGEWKYRFEGTQLIMEGSGGYCRDSQIGIFEVHVLKNGNLGRNMVAATTNAAGNSAQNGQFASIRKLWWVGLIAAVGASIANLVVFWVTKGVFGIPYIIPMGGPSGPLRPIPAALIIIFNVVPAIGATILLAVLAKFLSRPIRVFWIISVVAFVISFVLPLGLPSSVASSTRIGLGTMHPIAAAVIVGVLTKMGRQK